jgi:hypothetical protein
MKLPDSVLICTNESLPKVVLLTDSELPLTVADTPVLSLSELMLVAMSAIEVPDAKARISEPRVPVISMVDALVWVPLIESVPVSADAVTCTTTF